MSELQFIGKAQIIPPSDGWEPQTYYVVDVSFNSANPVHRSIFFSGFLDFGEQAGYAQVFNGSYEGPERYACVWYMKVISKIAGIGGGYE